MLNKKEQVQDGMERFNVAPTERVPAVILNDEGEREPTVQRCRDEPQGGQ